MATRVAGSLCAVTGLGDEMTVNSEMKVKGHPPDRPVYTMLITMCGRGGKFMEAANYLVEMTEMRLIWLLIGGKVVRCMIWQRRLGSLDWQFRMMLFNEHHFFLHYEKIDEDFSS